MTFAEIIHLLVDVLGGRVARIAEADIEKIHAALREHFGEPEPVPALSAEEEAKFRAWQAAEQAKATPVPVKDSPAA